MNAEHHRTCKPPPGRKSGPGLRYPLNMLHNASVVQKRSKRLSVPHSPRTKRALTLLSFSPCI